MDYKSCSVDINQSRWINQKLIANRVPSFDSVSIKNLTRCDGGGGS